MVYNENMARILALDVGEKTIGVALSDEAETLALPGETIVRQEGKKRDMASLRQLIAEKQVRSIVVGMPLLPDGSRGVQVEKVEAFIATLRNYVRIPIITEDERLTTWDAEQVLIEARVPREERKKVIDSMAASLILQSYLDRKRVAANRNPEE
jgi:putative holliday junction resolvase